MLLRHLTGAAIGGLVFSQVLFGHAMASDPPMCKPLKPALMALSDMAEKQGAKLTAIGPDKMQAFVAKLHEKGVEIDGDAALVWNGKKGDFMLFIRRGEFLCVPSLTPVTNTPKDAGKLDEYGRGWVALEVAHANA